MALSAMARDDLNVQYSQFRWYDEVENDEEEKTSTAMKEIVRVRNEEVRALVTGRISVLMQKASFSSITSSWHTVRLCT